MIMTFTELVDEVVHVALMDGGVQEKEITVRGLLVAVLDKLYREEVNLDSKVDVDVMGVGYEENFDFGTGTLNCIGVEDKKIALRVSVS